MKTLDLLTPTPTQTALPPQSRHPQTSARNRLKLRPAAALALLALLAFTAATAHAQTVRSWSGASSGAWLTAANWNSAANWPGSAPLANPTGEGAATDIATTLAANTAGNIGINMNTLTAAGGVGLILGGIELNKTDTATLQIGNSSTTVNGILQLNGATLNSVPKTLIRVAGSANLTIANVNTGTGTQTMGLRLGITDGIFEVGASRTLTISSLISEAAANSGFTKTGAGTLTLGGANTYSGATTISAGTLQFSSSASQTVSGNIDGAGSLTKSGTGTLTLGGANTYSGDTTISAGTLKLGAGGTLASTPNITVASGAGFDVSTPTTALTLGAGQTLNASATGGTTPGTIMVASGKNLTLGGTTTGLAFTAYGGGSIAPLTVAGASAGSLDLNSKPITVTTTTALPRGYYKLIAKSGSATVTGSPGTLTLNGGGVVSGATPTLQVVSGELFLDAGMNYWDIDGATAGAGGATPSGTWATGGTTWSTDSTGSTATSAYTTLGTDELNFSAGTDASGSYIITLGANQNAKGLTFEDGTATISANTLTLGGGGAITVATGAGNPIISSGLTANGGNTFNVGSGRTLTLDTDTFTRGTRAALNVQGAGTVTSTKTGLASGGLVNGIIGPWASFDTGAATKYATFSGNNIVGLAGTAAATAANVTDTTGTFNYDVAGGTATFGANASINTLRYTGTGGTLTANPTFTTKGIMNVGGGSLVLFVTNTAGSSGTEMVVNTANGNISMTGASGRFIGSINKTGPGTFTLGNGSDHSIGAMTVNEGVLVTGQVNGDQLTGATINSGGTLRWGSANKHVNSAVFTINAGGTLDCAGQDDLIGVINGSGSIIGTTGRLQVGAAGPSSFSGVISGSGMRLTVRDSGNLTLSGVNTYGGVTTVSGGVLIPTLATALPGYNVLNQVTFSGGTIATKIGNGTTTGWSTAQVDTLMANATKTSGSLGIDTTVGDLNQWTAFDTTYLGAALGLTKLGANKLTLNLANNYAGTTTIDNGTLEFTTVSPSFTGGLTFGAAAGSANVGALDLSSVSATFGNLTVQNNSAANNTITIGSGQTLLLNGAVTVGYNSAANSNTRLDVTGLGTLSIGTVGTPTGANVQVGAGQTSNVGNAATNDMSGLATFNTYLGTGSFKVGDPVNSGGAATAGSAVILATNSTIQATALTLGSPSGVTNSLKLGSGANVINVATLNLTDPGSSSRASGSLTFNGATGTLKVRSLADTVNGRATLNVGVVNFNTGFGQNSSFDTAGHSADLRFGTMTIGSRSINNGVTTGNFSFDTGTLDADDLIVGSRSGTAAAATTTGNVSLGGGTVTINNVTGPIQLGVNSLNNGTAAGTLNISGGTVFVAANGGTSIRLGQATTTGGTANGTLNLTGGTLTLAGDLVRGATTGTSTAVLALNGAGAILDMSGNDITGMTSLTYTDGTLTNLGVVSTSMTLAGTGSRVIGQGTGVSGEIQGFVSGPGVGLAKTGPGTLTLSGGATYNGPTAISAGKLTSSTAGSPTTEVTVAGGATCGILVATPGGQWVTSGSLTNDNGSGLEINYGSTAPSTTTAPIPVNNFSVGTGLSLKLVGVGFSEGQAYPLVTWTGTGPSDATAFTTLILPTSPAVTGYLTVLGNTLYLNVVTVSALSWNTGDGDWDTTSLNWTNTILNVAALYVDASDAVLFGDAEGATGNPVVNLTNAFSPLGVKMKSSSHDYTITNTIPGTGSIGGSGALILDSANTRTLTLATSNSYTGGTLVGGGTLVLSDAGTLGSPAGGVTLGGGQLDLGGLTRTNGSVTISAAAASGHTVTNGTLSATAYAVNNAAGNPIISANLGGAAAFTKSGAGIVTLAGTNTYAGNTTISVGTVKLGASGVIPVGAGKGNVTVNGTLDLNNFSLAINGLSGAGTVDNTAAGTPTLTVGSNDQSSAFSGVISNTAGTLALTKVGTGTLTLGGSNTYSGATTVNRGTLAITHNNALGTTAGTTTVNGNDTATAATLNLSSATNDLTIAENINFYGNGSGRAQLVNNSAQNHTLTGNIDVSSDTNLVQFTANGAGSITLSGDITGTLANGAVLFLRGNTPSTNNAVTGNITLTGGSLAKTDSGTWTVGAPGKTISLNAGLLVANGILKMGAANVLATTPVLTMGNTTGNSGGTLDLNGLDQTIAGIIYNGAPSTTGTKTITSSAGTPVLTVTNATDYSPTAGSAANSVVLTGSLGLTKTGAGTLTLSAANTYTGATTISGGELIGKTAGSCANSVVTVASGATNGVQLAAANGQWTCAGLTYSAGTTYADFDFTAIAPSTTVAPLNINGNLAVNSTVNVITRSGSALTAGTSYPLITWSGTGPTNLNDFGTVTLPSAMPGTLSLNIGTKTISVMAGITVPNLAYTNAPGFSRKIALADIQAAGLASAQGSPTYTITLPSGTSAQGGSVTTDGSLIFYTPSGTPASDSFSYTVSDGIAAATATVTITFASVAGAQIDPAMIGNDGADHAQFTFRGIPNTTYHVQRATVLTPTPNWTNADAGVSTGADGSYLWTDTVTITSLGGTVYYRISYP